MWNKEISICYVKGKWTTHRDQLETLVSKWEAAVAVIVILDPEGY